jgi:cell division septation protein DedD
MVLDYSEHKSVNKNRPRKQPAATFLFSLFVAVSIAFTLGVATGWLIFRPTHKSGADRSEVAANANQKAAATAPNQVQISAEPAGKTMEPSLTFYETLPKGNRELMGSGLNLPKSADRPPAQTAPKLKPATLVKTAASQEPPAQNKEAVKSAAQNKEAVKTAAQNKEAVKTTAKASEPIPAKETADREGEGKARFVVQISSYHLKKEAEEARDRLKDNGTAAYIIESNIPEKGTWYRVRVGRHLDQKTAREVADKAGKGSIIIPE